MNSLFAKIFILSSVHLTVSVFVADNSSAEYANKILNIHPEVLISSQGDDLDYYKEDFRRMYYNFEYPKLITIDNSSPIIAFIDEKANRLIVTEIGYSALSTLGMFPPFQDNYQLGKWPIIFVQNSNIYFATLGVTVNNNVQTYKVKILLFDKRDGSLSSKYDKSFSNPEPLKAITGKASVSLYGIYPIGIDINKYLVVGRFTESYFHPLTLLSGEPVRLSKSFSFELQDDNINFYQPMDKSGRFSAYQQRVIVSKTGLAHTIWVRDTRQIINNHNEIICYSCNKSGYKWTEPLELYNVKTSKHDDQIRTLSLASYNESIYLLWNDFERGIYFEEINNGNKQKIINISEEKDYIEGKRIVFLSGAPTAKITTDDDGNVYIIWIINTGNNYKIFLKAKIRNEWKENVLVNSGTLAAKLPDITVDKKGGIHITYVKEMRGDKTGCYYIKIDKQQ